MCVWYVPAILCGSVIGSLKIEGKHVRKGSKWAPRELSGELYDKILRLFAAVIKSY